MPATPAPPRLLPFVVGVVWALGAAGPAWAQGSEFCWKDTEVRGVGTVPPTCAPGHERIGLLCYDECPEGTARFGFDCHSVCPDGMDDQGLFCRRSEYGRGAGYPWQWGDPLNDSAMRARCERDHGQGNCEPWGAVIYPKCAPGYEPFGCCICRPQVPDCEALGLNPGIDLSCAKRVAIGAPETGVCPAGLEMDAGLCYPPCEAGYDGVGPVCWADTPDGWVDCGMGAASDDAACAEVVFDQVSSVGQMAMFVGTFGTSSAATGAAGAGRGAARLARLRTQYDRMRRAWNRVKDTPEVRAVLRNAEAAQLVHEGVDIAREAQDATTEEDMVRVGAQIAALLDPTGVASTVAAYTHPVCSKVGLGPAAPADDGPDPDAALTATEVTGWNVVRADHRDGSFRQTGDRAWAEYDRSGRATFTFTEVGRDDWSVYLDDPSRGVQVQIDLHRDWLTYGTGGGPRSDLYAITSAWRRR